MEASIQTLCRDAWLLVYDIGEPKRLRQVEKIAKTYGVRLQRSVFLCEISEMDLEEMAARLRVRMDAGMDDVRIYHLPKGTKIGQNHPSNLPDGIILSMGGVTL